MDVVSFWHGRKAGPQETAQAAAAGRAGEGARERGGGRPEGPEGPGDAEPPDDRPASGEGGAATAESLRDQGEGGQAPCGQRLRCPFSPHPAGGASRFLSPEEARRAAEVADRRGAAPGFPRFFLTLNAGLVLTAVAIVVFKTPNHFAFGGTSGVSVILNTFFPDLPVSAFMWILNIALVVLGLLFLDFKVVGWSVYASIALSGYTSLVELVYPSTQSPTGDMWLDLCFAVLLPAVGSALVFDVGASTGGTDIAALILKKHSSLQIGKALLVVDIGIVAIAAFLYGPRVGLYCVLGLFAKTMVVDTAIESLHLRKVCTVICSRPGLVEEFIVRELNRSATVTHGVGAYTGAPLTILMSVLTRREAMRLRLFVRRIEPGAFITIVNSSEIIGRGFRGVG